MLSFVALIEHQYLMLTHYKTCSHVAMKGVWYVDVVPTPRTVSRYAIREMYCYKLHVY